MLNAIITASLRNRFLVLLVSAGITAAGLHSLLILPIDAFPDTTPVLVQVNAAAPALGPEQIERQLVIPIERVMGGMPALSELRSISKFGFGQVSLVFADGTDIFRARQMIQERLQQVELPDGARPPELGPISTGLGEILHYIVSSPGRDLMELTTLNERYIRPRLLTVPGVAEVNTWGGLQRQLQVEVNPDQLLRYQLTFDDLTAALRQDNQIVGGGAVSQAGELHIVQGLSTTPSAERVGEIVVRAFDGVPVRIRDVATVREGHELRRGGVTANGAGEIVHGLGFMLMGENSHAVTGALEQRLNEVRSTLPPDVALQVVYERSELVEHVLATVKRNLLEGALLVVAVLFIFLGNLRAGLLVALAIPLAMLFAFNGMLQLGIAASLLSLGAIDFGLVVDSSVIMVENAVRKLGDPDDPRHEHEIIRDACVEVRRPTMFGELIILSVYLPILLLEGVEGKLFRPLALTVVLALLGSLLFSLTLVPVLCSFMLKRRKTRRGENLLVRAAQWVFRPLVRLATRRPGAVIVSGAAVLAAALPLAVTLGANFIPRLSEMAIVMNTVRLSGVSLEESVRVGTQLERLIRQRFPDEVRDVWSRTGTAAVATDPMGLEVTDTFITLTPREHWTRAQTQDELTQRIEEATAGFPGMNRAFTQPIEMRMNEMTAGIRADLGIRIFGEDLETLRGLAMEVRETLERIPGAADLSVEQLTGLPVLEVQVAPEAIARFGVPAQHVLEAIGALGGVEVGRIRDGEWSYGLALRLDPRFARDANAIRDVRVATAAGEQIPLERLTRIVQTTGPASIQREWGRRRIVVQCNVRGRDLAGFVAEARRRLAAEIALPAGYSLSLGGQFEHLLRASRRLAVIVPIAIATVLSLLYLSTRSLRDTLIIASGAIFAGIGGVVALWLREMPFTISAGVGFVAVSGVSVLNGLVLVSTIRQRLAEGASLTVAIEQTRLIRLRPILMTALVAALGFVPMAISTGIGAEVQRPLATVVIGGVIVDNLLTLAVLPALVAMFGLPRRASQPATGTAPAARTALLRSPGMRLFAVLALLLAPIVGCARVDARGDYERAAREVEFAVGSGALFQPTAEPPAAIDELLRDGLTAEKAVRLALRNNPAVQAACYEIGIARAEVVQAGLLENPTIMFGMGLPDGGGLVKLEAALSQNLAELWQIPARRRAAERDLERKILSLAQVSAQTALDAKLAYYAAARADLVFEIRRDNRQIAAQLLELTLVRQQAGAGSEVEVNLARAAQLETEVALLKARRERVEARAELARLAGLDAGPQELALSEPLRAPESGPPSAAALLDAARGARLDLRTAAEEVAAAEARLELERTRFLKSLQVGVGIERGARGRIDDRNLGLEAARKSFEAGEPRLPDVFPRRPAAPTDYMIGPSLGLELPIFDQNQAQIARAAMQAEQARRTLRAVELAIVQATHAKVEQAQAAWETTRFYAAELLPLRNRNLELSREAYLAGRIPFLTVLETEREFLRVRQEQADALLDAARADVDLERLAGRPLAALRAATASAPASQPLQ